MNASRFHSACRLGLGLMTLALPLAARAQAPAKIFVSATGSDTAAGTLTAPKRSFQAAHDAVAAGGEIVALNTAGYGALNITKSVAVTVPTGITGFITVGGGSSGITINAATTDVVILRGLTIEGGNDANNGRGIVAQTVGNLRVDNCTIRSFRVGILTEADGSRMEITNCNLRDSGDGVYVSTSNGTTARANVVGCKIDNIANSGVYAYVADTGTSLLTATNCVLSHCGRGAYSFNGGATVYVDGCILSGDTTAVLTTGDGAVITRTSNTLVNNGDNGAFTGTLAAQ